MNYSEATSKAIFDHMIVGNSSGESSKASQVKSEKVIVSARCRGRSYW